ncbi:DUF4105 domain-containing protein [Marinospirillum sp.]|uniref:Lnb N-terminal periplasmic domain-containing protein n=1 Tax=Marinospirillum sp. TaxID=2183934 RepID=UPI00286FF867|nr:DUF4105 domain-containing protein [Marinospirillum sp.]MDR9469132.1 DUF4105 domain-containing protein [Marinospirillum sp.]
MSQSNIWLRLLHFHHKGLGYHYSQVDDPDFFLSDEGHRDPLKELQATWQQLQSNLEAQKLPDENADLRCIFPARVDFLERHLGIEVPERACPKLDDWQETITPESLTMIFPAAYMNDAASMFGHTLLRIDSKDKRRSSDLMAWAVNFAAEIEEGDGGMAYAIKGMLGLYTGYFSLMPYYEKVNEYNQMENRDMWEYPLNLSEEGLQRVIWHLWELDEVGFDYWFFDENCSYQLLALLSVAEDDLYLTQGFDIKALPVDTLRALDEAGLLDSQGHYRPSFATRLQVMSEQLTQEEVQLARTLVFDQPHPNQLTFPKGVNAAAVYELAAEWLNFRFRHQDLEREQAAPQIHRLLVARSKVEEKANLQAPVAPEVAPHQGHDTARWGLGTGYHQDQNYLSLVAKPSYHSRFDDLDGYLPNAEINLFELEVRAYEEEETLEPWHLTILEVGNYLPSSPIFSLAAWRVQAEVERTDVKLAAKDSWRSRLGGSYGRAWGNGRELMAYAFVNGELEAGPSAGHLESTDPKDWALGGGLNLGFVWSPTKPLRMGLDGRWTEFLVGNEGQAAWLEGTLQWNFARQQSLRLQGEWEDRGIDTDWQAGLQWLRYF